MWWIVYAIAFIIFAIALAYIHGRNRGHGFYCYCRRCNEFR